MILIWSNSAGVTDSALTNHGVLQATRLASYLATKFRFTHIFSSDLQRAFKTATAVQNARQREYSELVEVYQLKILQEQDFGSFERMTFAARAKSIGDNVEPIKQPETKEALASRAELFLNDYLLPLLFSESTGEINQVAIVSHGLLLSALWRCLLRRFNASHVDLARGVEVPTRDMSSLEHIGSWSNTGYLELSIDLMTSESISKSSSLPDEDSNILEGYKMTILGINTKAHLQGLKRTGGGVGSSKHDEKQKSIESFFTRPRNA